MEEMILIMAAASDKDEIVQRMKTTIQTYQDNKNEENFQKVVFEALLLTAKASLGEGSDEEVLTRIREMKQFQGIHKHMKNSTN